MLAPESAVSSAKRMAEPAASGAPGAAAGSAEPAGAGGNRQSAAAKTEKTAAVRQPERIRALKVSKVGRETDTEESREGSSEGKGFTLILEGISLFQRPKRAARALRRPQEALLRGLVP